MGLKITGTDIINTTTTADIQFKDHTGSTKLKFSRTGEFMDANDVMFIDPVTRVLDNVTNVNWDAAYNDRITAVSVSGGPTKTITLTQQDGGTLTASWSDTDTDTNTFLSSAAFNIANGVLTLTRSDSVTVTVDLDGRFYNQTESDGRYVNVTGDTMTGALGISTSVAGSDAFYVDGTYGRLFTVTDDLTDAVFSANTISGLPIIEAYSDYSVKMGRYGQSDFYINPSGNVGIGTTSPTNKLQIGSVASSGYGGNDLAIGDGTSTFAIYMASNLTNFYTNKAFSFQASGAGSTGNVLIGTTTDAGYKLDVNGTGSFTGNVFSGSSFRAPIFYDSVDTNYYVDPNSSSVLYSTNINRAQITNDVTTSSGQGRFGGWYTGTGYTGAAVEVGFSGGSGYVIAYNRDTATYQPLFFNGSNIYLNPASGSVYINTSPIIRQSAGTGWLSGNYASSETSATTGAIYSIGGSYYPTGSSLNTMYGVGYTNAAQGAMPTGAADWGFYVVSNGTARVWLGADSGNIIATGNIYAETNRIVATQAWVSAQGYLTSLSSHNHDDRYYTETESDTRYYLATNPSSYITSSALSGYATQTYVNDAISDLVASAPDALDTLNELAAALGEDPNFATTVTNSIAGKLALTGGTLSGTLTINADEGLKVAYSGGGNTWIRGWGFESDRGAVYLRPTTNNTQTLLIGYPEGSQNWGTVLVGAAGFTWNGETVATRTWTTSQGYQAASTAINTSNIGSQSVSYETTAGSAPADGGNSSTVGGFGAGSFFRDLGFEGGGADANTIAETRSAFTYASGSPWTGPLAYFGAAGYGLQLNATYQSGVNISYRTRNGDTATWNSWREFIHAGNIGSQSVNYAAEAGSATTATNLGADYTADDWLRATADNNPVKLYGNSRQMAFRTDGTTEYATGVGGYAFAWMYGGDAASNRRMLMDTSGNLWTNTYGWLHDYFQIASTAITTSNIGSQSVSYATSAGNADTVDSVHAASFVRNDVAQPTVQRHFDASTTWTNDAITLFLGWYGSKVVIGNNNEDNHDAASALGGNTIAITNTLYSFEQSNLYYNGSLKLYMGSDGTRNTGWAYHTDNGTGLHWPNNGWHLMPASTADFRIYSGNSSESALRFETSGTTRGYVYASSSNEIGFLNNDRTWRLRVYPGGAVESYGDFRAPIFYDQMILIIMETSQAPLDLVDCLYSRLE